MSKQALQNIDVRVLVVDDSPVIRKLLSSVLNKADGITVVGEAVDGKDALEQVTHLRPDVITMDLEMPLMGGFQAIAMIQGLENPPSVLVVSTFADDDASCTAESIRRGADGVVLKPVDCGGQLGEFRKTLVRQVLALNPRNRQTYENSESAAISTPETRTSRFSVAAIGVSTGGPEALACLFKDLPESFPIPIVIVQHMPAEYTRPLAESLNEGSNLNIVEAQDGLVLQPGTAIVAQGGRHLEVRSVGNEVHCKLSDGPHRNGCRPSVDVLFSSLAEVYGSKVLGIVMTGMGHDGLDGCRELHRVGATILAQDKETSVVHGMPGSVIDAGLHHQEVPLESLSKAMQLASTRRSA